MYPDDVPAAEDRRMCEGKEPVVRGEEGRPAAAAAARPRGDSDPTTPRRLFLRHHWSMLRKVDLIKLLSRRASVFTGR